jgi:alpha-galactosidase
VNWDQLEWPAGLKADVAELWTGAKAKGVVRRFSGTVASHGVLMLRLTPVP